MITIQSTYNPYRDNVQGKANEPICVAGLLDRARRILGLGVQCDLGDVWDRLESNAPRIAIIGGSPDHPAHVMDLETTLRAAAAIWNRGGVPFAFGVPAVCDGTAQSTRGMCYSLQSRNAVTQMVVNQMEGQSYHGAFVIQGCDKTPMAIVCALALLDRTRRARGEPPVFATFAPAHVLKGGTIPADLRADLTALADRADSLGHADIATDTRDTLEYILQCSSNQSFQGVLTRAVGLGLLTRTQHKDFEKRLAVNTCDAKGGICAFHGTGNSSRDMVAALGLVHPAVEFLTDPPTQSQVDVVVASLMAIRDDPRFGASALVRENLPNAVRVHSALGGSTNLVMHLVAAMIHAGVNFSLHDLDAIHRETPIPDIFNYSLTEGRDVFALAQQCCAGQIRGMETVLHELTRNGVPMTLDAPTVAGKTWRERLDEGRAAGNLSADGVTDPSKRIILSTPRRAVSGVDVLAGNWFESAVVKISGMPDAQLNEFDEQVAAVVYFENEDDANAALLDVKFVSGKLEARLGLTFETLRAIHTHNSRRARGDEIPADELLPAMLKGGTLKIAIVVSGQGPEAYGMPEMATPNLYINADVFLRRLTTLISDGRYSGVSYGAAVGHVTPEAARGGGILYLRDGDLLHLRLRARRIDLLDPSAFARGEIRSWPGDLAADRAELGRERLARIQKRRMEIAPTNQMIGYSDAAHGVVPPAVMAAAGERVEITK